MGDMEKEARITKDDLDYIMVFIFTFTLCDDPINTNLAENPAE